MASFNKVILFGNLTRDPELRVTPGGLSIARLGLATNRVFTGKDGDKKEEVTFVDITAFGRQAETICKYLTKGDSLLIEGRLKLETWETQNGEKRSKLIVILETFQFGPRRGESTGPAATPPPKGPANAIEDEEDDVPF